MTSDDMIRLNVAKIPGRILLTALVVGIGGNFQWGFQWGIVNTISTSAINLLNESYQQQNQSASIEEINQLWSMGVNTFLIGGLIGTIPATVVAEKLGRKNAIMANNLVSICGSILCCLWPLLNKFPLFMAGRFVVGVHAGLNLVFVSIYMSEVSLIQHRGFLGSLQNTFMGVFVALAAIIGLPDILGNKFRLPIVLILPAIVSCLFSVIFYFFPDSPKFQLITRHDDLTAEKSAGFFYQNELHCRQYLTELHNERLSQSSQIKTTESWLKSLLNAPKTVLCGFLVALVCACSIAFSGICGILNFSTLIFMETGMDERLSLNASVVLLCCSCVFGGIGSFVVGRVERRKLLLGSIFATLVFNIMFISLSELGVGQPQLCANWCNWLKISTVIAFSCAYQLGIGSISLFISNELVPQKFRSFTSSVCMATVNILFISTGLALLPLSQQIHTLSLLVLYVIPTAICFLFLYRFLPETKNKTIAEVQQSLQMNFATCIVLWKTDEKSASNCESVVDK